MVTAQAPDVPLGVARQHAGRAPPDFVDVIDLPGGVVQEADRRGQGEQVVVVGGAAQERAGPLDVVADLEAEPVGEERRGSGQVSGADHRVPQLARQDRPGPQDAGRPVAGSFGAARAVVRGRRDLGLGQPRGDL